MSTTQRKDIIDGPTADRMIDSFKYVFVEGCKLPVQFTVKMSTAGTRTLTNYVRGNITALSYDSGTPGMLNFRLNCTDGGGRVVGYYDANSRSGWLEFQS